MLAIRPEEPRDIDAVRRVNEAAFPGGAEARLVDLLRQNGKATVSLVADLDGTIIGHILFSPVTVDGKQAGLGLAPVAVRPDQQRKRIGTQLIEAGLEACRAVDAPLAVVLGYPAYYQRFGFRRASDVGIGNAYGVDEEFMAIIWRPDALAPGGGLVEYAPEFASLTS